MIIGSIFMGVGGLMIYFAHCQAIGLPGLILVLFGGIWAWRHTT
jgi:hypothetical protein